MSSIIEYVIPLQCHTFEGNILSQDGVIRQQPIKLVSSKGLIDPTGESTTCSVSDSLEDVYESILRGEETGWSITSVATTYCAVGLVFTKPTSTKDDWDFIHISRDQEFELQFEIERGEGIASDKLEIYTTTNNHGGRSRCISDPPLRIVETLNGGAFRRQFILQRVEMNGAGESYFIVTEERF